MTARRAQWVGIEGEVLPLNQLILEKTGLNNVA